MADTFFRLRDEHGPEMRSKLLVIGVAIALVSTTVGMSAFTSAQMGRSANIDVVADQSGLIGLETGTSGDLIQQNSSGALTIDLTRGGASGANVHAHFEFGSTSDPQNQTAFNITNHDTEKQTFTIDYTGTDSDSGDDSFDVKFKVYASGGDTTAEAVVTDEDSSGASFTLSPGGTAYVVMIIDTEADKGDAIDGTVEISA